jgi:hypothetical protein
MKYFLTILLFLPFAAMAQPAANAGADQTIYWTTTNSVTLNGSASTGTGLGYVWREVSSDYSSLATITSPTSVSTTVTGLPQGVFYFELQVTDNVDRVAVDTVAVIVDYAPPPATNTLVTHAIWSDMAYGANLRNDTTTCFSWTSDIRSLVGTSPNDYIMEKDGTLGSWIDSMRQKYYSVILDGHGCSGYGRSEIIPAEHAQDYLDTSKIYVIEWKGYFNQEMSGYAGGTGQGVGVLMQMHGSDGNTPPFGFGLHGTDIQFSESSDSGNGVHNGVNPFDAGGNFHVKIFNTTDLTKSCHTLRVTIKEGKDYPGQTAFLKIQFDGVTKYYRNVGQVGATFMSDWLKGATVYDYDNLVTDAANHTRGKTASLVTEAYRVYTVTDTTVIPPPTISMPSNQTITVGNTSVTATATWASGHSGTYLWTKTSGGSATITTPSSASTTITGLSNGTYVFQCKATQDDAQFVTGNVTVVVNMSGITNYSISSGGQKIMINQ